MVRNLGAHVLPDSIHRLRRYTNLFQISLHDAKFFEFSLGKIMRSVMEWRALCPDAFFVVHGPYITNIMIDNKILKSSIQCVRHHLDACLALASPYLVIHPGTRNFKGEDGAREIPLDVSVKHTKTILNFIMKDYVGKPVKLLLENMANTKLKGLPMDKLIEIVDEMGPNVGLCFDLEHAFARGEDVSRFEEYMERADVIHFNSVPGCVEHGNGVDQHSGTTLEESVRIPPEKLKYWLVKFNHKIKILEMTGPVAERTLKSLEKEIQEGKI